jgi:hypothetical protein
MTTTLVRYRVKPEHAEQNRELIRAVYSELELTQLADIRYATFTLDDGVSFVHLHASDSERSPLLDLPAFRAFQEGIEARCEEQPVFAKLDTVGSFGWLPDRQSLSRSELQLSRKENDQ